MAILSSTGIAGFLSSAKATGKQILNKAGKLVPEFIEYFVPGFAGYGWKIWERDSGVWRMETDELVIRRTMIVFEMLISKIRCIKGALNISQANGKIKTAELKDGKWYITIEDEMSFVPHDIIRCQHFSNGTKFYWVEIDDIIENNSILVIPATEFTGSLGYKDGIERVVEAGSMSVPEPGDEIIQFGNSKNTDRQSAIYLHADEGGQPAIDILFGIKSKSFDGCLKQRMGGSIPGGEGAKGFYCENGMIKGTDSTGHVVYCIHPDGSAEFGDGSAIFSNKKSGHIAGGAISWEWNKEKQKFVCTMKGVVLTWENLDEEAKKNLKGDTGLQGVPGTPGQDGKIYYTWIRYADTAEGEGIGNSPVGKIYMGLAYNKESATESDNPSDYTWSRFRGEDGTAGVAGTPGQDGKTNYTWIAYSDYPDGINMYQIPNDNTKYVGIAVNKETATESNVPSEYIWSKFKGEDGKDGINGAAGVNGENGRDGDSMIYKGELDSDPQNPQNGWYYRNKNDKKCYVYQDGSWYQMTVDGVNGANGKDGNDGLDIVWKGDLAEAPKPPQKNWVYRDTDNRTVYIYNGSAWVLMLADGNDGEGGAKGEDGFSVFITYNDSLAEPSKPTGSGITGGWHTNTSSSVVWMSQKVAKVANEGEWGKPIKVKGENAVMYMFEFENKGTIIQTIPAFSDGTPKLDTSIIAKLYKIEGNDKTLCSDYYLSLICTDADGKKYATVDFEPSSETIFSVFNGPVSYTVSASSEAVPYPSEVVCSSTISIVCDGQQGEDAEVPDWLKDWDGFATEIGSEYIVTPSLFSGTKNSETGALTGVAQGRDCITIGNEKHSGLFGLKDNKLTFEIDALTGDAVFRGKLETAKENTRVVIDPLSNPQQGVYPGMTIYDINGELAATFNGASITSINDLYGSSGLIEFSVTPKSHTLQDIREEMFDTRDLTLVSFTAETSGVISIPKIEVTTSIDAVDTQPYMHVLVTTSVLVNGVSVIDNVSSLKGQSTIGDSKNFDNIKIPVSKGPCIVVYRVEFRVAQPYQGYVNIYTTLRVPNKILFSDDMYMSRYFANGFALGSTVTNFFECLNVNSSMILRAMMSNYGFNFTEKGVQLKLSGKWYTLSVDGGNLKVSESALLD